MSFYGSDYDYADYMDATDYYNSQCENFSQEFYTSEDQSSNMLEIQNILKELSAHCRSFRVPKRSVNRTKVKVSSKISKSPASVPLLIAPISLPTGFTETPVTLKVDSSEDSDPHTDDNFLHMPPDNLEFPCPTQSTILLNSLSAVDPENTMEMLDISVAVIACIKEEASLDSMHVPPSVEQFSPFSIIPTTQTFMDLFHSGTLHQFELGRDPPVILHIADSKSRFGLVQKFKDLFHTCTLHQFELGRDPPNVLDIGDSRFGFG